VDRIDLFRIFARVVECSSFARAADGLGMPRSSVSAAVLALEGRVGATLLNRTTRKVAPTQDGLAFYERCLSVIAEAEETENHFRQAATKPLGKLKVDVPSRIGRLIVVPALPDFLDAYPGIEIALGVTDRAVDLIADAVDCALRVGAANDSGLGARPIGLLPLINVASPVYLARHGTPTTPHDLANHWAVNYASPSTGRVANWERLEDGALHAQPTRSRISVNSAEAYIAGCLAGLGLIQIPAYDVKGHLAAGELVEVMPDHRAEPMPVTLLYPEHQRLSRRLQACVEWLEDLLKRELLLDS
jgi:LysR family transcriptional regulator, regulator for bpeEF and oprC